MGKTSAPMCRVMHLAAFTHGAVALTFFDFLSHAMAQPILFVILILVIGVTAVSGATDAPNAIATVVSTRCLSPNAAIALAAVFNFVGLVGMTYISTAVAKTMFGMVDFSGDTNSALYALVAAMIGAILWGIACWYFGIPCSKSHSLIAGITGGAIAMNGWSGVVPTEWAKVIYGMVFSLVAGFVLGWLFTRLIEWIFKFVQRQAANKIFTIIQDIAAVALSSAICAQRWPKFAHRHAGHRACSGSAPRLIRAASAVDYGYLFRRHFARHNFGRQAHHQVGRHGYGEAREISGPCGELLHDVYFWLR